MIRILLLEPYYGGSHKQFINGLRENISADFTLLHLPARKWKMRMQLSALWFTQQIKDMPACERFYDYVLCSTFVDVALFKAVALTIKGWNLHAPIKTYFHENQFAYPNRQHDMAIRQFMAINFNSAVASDECAFNSYYNMESFFRGIKKVTSQVTDMEISSCVDEIVNKSIVIPPGIDYALIDICKIKKNITNPPVIVWNHRWEYDKDPELFFSTLYRLQEEKIDFRLIVLGKSYQNIPDCFTVARERLKKETIHFGFVKSRRRYAELLLAGDIVVSTAKHEFFGISVLEAIRAGCRPLLPADLSYLELYEDKYLYGPGELFHKLKTYIETPVTLCTDSSRKLTERFTWKSLKGKYSKWLLD